MQCLSRRLGEGGAVDISRPALGAQTRSRGIRRAREIEPKIRRLMELPDGSLPRIISREHCGDDRFDCDLLRAVADANRKWGARSGLGHAESSRDGSR